MDNIFFNLKGLWNKNVLLRLLLCLTILYPYLLPIAVYATDVDAKLNSANGSTSFRVLDSADVEVASIDSNGNIVVLGSATIRGNGAGITVGNGGGITVSSLTLNGVSTEGSLPNGSLIYNTDGRLRYRTGSAWVTVSTAIVSGGTSVDVTGSTQTKIGGLYLAGNLGIGTANADQSLVAYGVIESSGSSAGIKIHSSGASPYLQIAGDDADPYIRFIDDSNGGAISFARMGVNYNSSNPYFYFNYADNDTAQHLAIRSTGNIGIGTNSPASLLDINGGSLTVRTPYGLAVGTMMVVQTGSGNLGIGTNSPLRPMHFYGSEVEFWLNDTSNGDSALTRTMSGIFLTNGNATTTNKYTPALKFGSTDSSLTTENPKFLAGIIGRVSQTYAANGDGGMAIDILTTDDTPGTTSLPNTVATFSNDGFFGVGNPKPTQKIHMSSGTLKIDGDTEVAIITKGSVGVGTTSPSGGFSVGASTLVVTEAKVGVGTTDPSSKLDVNGGSITIRGSNSGLYSTGNFKIENNSPLITFHESDASADNGIWLWKVIAEEMWLQAINDSASGGGNLLAIGRSGNNLTTLRFGSTTNPVLFMNCSTNKIGIGNPGPAEKLHLSSGTIFIDGNNSDSIIAKGNVSIGTTAAPAVALDVVGRIRMGTWTADGDTAVYKDDPTGNLGTQASDVRLKKNIEPLANALELISRLHAYKYNMKDESDSAKKRLGIMAQELLGTMPELTYNIKNNESGETYYGVHYEKLTVLLIEAMQEMEASKNSQLQELRNEIEMLKEKMNGK